MPQRDPGVYLEDLEHYAPQLLAAVQEALKAFPDPSILSPD